MKDEIVQTLLPRAFIRRSSTFAAIAPSLGLILVDSASAKKAEDLLSTLREALGSLPVRPLSVKVAPTATLTDWVKTRKPPATSTCSTNASCATPTRTAAWSVASART